MLTSAKFFLYDDTPVTFQPTVSGGLRVLVLDLRSLEFFADSTYHGRMPRGRDNLTREIGETEFRQVLARLGASLPDQEGI